MLFKDLPADARPREKLLARGPPRSADAELLALLLRTGMRRQGRAAAGAGAARRASAAWPGLLHAEPDELKRIKGLGGSAKRAELAAVLELARRALAEQLHERAGVRLARTRSRTTCSCSSARAAHEVFAVLFLDAQNRLIAHGGDVSRHADADQRLPARGRQARAASSTPRRWSWRTTTRRGAAEPSRADEFLTQTLKAALALVDVRVLDHLVVGQGEAVSLAERGLL